MPLTVTVLALPTFLSANVAVVRLSVTASPLMWLSESVTVAAVVPSYTLLVPVAVTVRASGVMLAVVVAVVLARV